jgi:hypothetical protein
MSSDDDLDGPDNRRRRSLATPVPPSAGGGGPESPKFDSSDYPDKRGSVNGMTSATASDIATSDERVRQVLYSDVRSPCFKKAAHSV